MQLFSDNSVLKRSRTNLADNELVKNHDWEGCESVPLLTLLAVGSFSFVAGGIV